MEKERPSFVLDADLLSLRSFLAIIDKGSFSAAADQVGRTQSAVSLQIARLEERMGVSLLERTSRSVKLTPEGETFASYARKIISLSDEGFAAVTALETEEPLRLGITEYLVPRHLKRILSHIKRSLPRSKVTLKLGLGFELYEDLHKGGLDLIAAGYQGDDGMRLLAEPLVWAGAPERSEEKDGPLSIIQMKGPCSYRKAAVDSLEKSHRIWREEVSVNNMQGVLSAVEAGFGVSALPRSAVDSRLIVPGGELPELPETSINLYWNRTNPHPLTNRCIELFKEEFRFLGAVS